MARDEDLDSCLESLSGVGATLAVVQKPLVFRCGCGEAFVLSKNGSLVELAEFVCLHVHVEDRAVIGQAGERPLGAVAIDVSLGQTRLQ